MDSAVTPALRDLIVASIADQFDPHCAAIVSVLLEPQVFTLQDIIMASRLRQDLAKQSLSCLIVHTIVVSCDVPLIRGTNILERKQPIYALCVAQALVFTFLPAILQLAAGTHPLAERVVSAISSCGALSPDAFRCLVRDTPAAELLSTLIASSVTAAEAAECFRALNLRRFLSPVAVLHKRCQPAMLRAYLHKHDLDAAAAADTAEVSAPHKTTLSLIKYLPNRRGAGSQQPSDASGLEPAAKRRATNLKDALLDKLSASVGTGVGAGDGAGGGAHAGADADADADPSTGTEDRDRAVVFCLDFESFLSMVLRDLVANDYAQRYDRSVGDVVSACMTVSLAGHTLGALPFIDAPAVHDTRPFTTDDVLKELTRLAGGPGDRRVDSEVLPQLLLLLTQGADAPVSLTRSGLYVFCCETVLRCVRSEVHDRLIVERYGALARRIVGLLRHRGPLEANQIATEGIMGKAQCSSLILRLLRDGVLEARQVAKTADYNPDLSLFLYGLAGGYASVMRDLVLRVFCNMRGRLQALRAREAAVVTVADHNNLADQVENVECALATLMETLLVVL